VTFKDLRKIITEKNKQIERESKLYNPSYHWKVRKIVSLDQWFQIKENYTLEGALQYFPNDFPSFGFSYMLDNIEDQMLKQEAEQQGLKEEHIQYKDRIVEFFTNTKDRIKVEDLRVY